jgi:Phage integrase, N-terminal SAM-like domain
MRNYSDKTLEAYRYRIGKFEAFVRSKPPDHLDTEDVKGFPIDVAVRQNVSAREPNQDPLLRCMMTPNDLALSGRPRSRRPWFAGRRPVRSNAGIRRRARTKHGGWLARLERQLQPFHDTKPERGHRGSQGESGLHQRRASARLCRQPPSMPETVLRSRYLRPCPAS